MIEEIKKNWQNIKEAVRDEYDITSVPYRTWIEPLDVYDITDDNRIRIIFNGDSYNASSNSKNDFAIGYITKKYALPFQVTIEMMTGFQGKVEFLSCPPVIGSNYYAPVDANKFQTASQVNPNLNPRYTFDTFVVGANNSFAHAASLSVAESPGKEYNPLFIYGGPGLGKTHLMHSIAHFVLENNPNAKVMYVTSEVFMNEVIDSIRNKNETAKAEFRDKYRNIDLLLIDDIQFIIGRGETTETEFFNTFNFLHGNGKQIVLSSDKPPRAFTTLEERLRSRFEGGLSVDISAPDYETRMAILRKKEENDGYAIDNEILQYIASNIKTNIRELEGALTKMYAYSKLHQNSVLTLDIAKENLKDVINPENDNKRKPEYIIKVVADQYGIRPEDIKSMSRKKEIVTPRHIAMYLIRFLNNDISLEDVGKAIGDRDHTTVIHGCEKIDNLIKEDSTLASEIDVLKKKLTE